MDGAQRWVRGGDREGEEVTGRGDKEMGRENKVGELRERVN